MAEITRILQEIEQGDDGAAERLLPIVYRELRNLAAGKLRRERPGQTLQPTALVHEAYLRLVSGEDRKWQGRGHFFGAAAEAMRRILIEAARRKKRLKRGGDRQRWELVDVDLAVDGPSLDVLALDEALEKLAAEDAEKAKLVELRFFAGLTLPEAAEILGVSRATAERYWTYARAWLHDEMTRGETRLEDPGSD